MKKLLTLGLLMTAVILTGCSKTTTDDNVAVAIPEGCTSWFDGCNNCMVKDGKADACTRMYCETPTAAKCTQFAGQDTETPAPTVNEKQDVKATTPTIPENCTSRFDGCNNCSVKDGKADACTMMYCEKPAEPKCNAFKE